MLDSGFRYTEADGRAQWDAMIEEARAEPAKVAIEANQWRVGATRNLRVWGTVTNTSDTVYGYDNNATLNITVYEEKQYIHIDHFVHASVPIDIDPDLEPGGSITFDQVIELPGRPNMAKVHAVVLVDYRPEPAGEFVSLNAAMATPQLTPPPPENDEVAAATVIDALPYDVEQNTAGAGAEPDEVTASCGQKVDNGVWYSHTPDEDVTVTIDTLMSDEDFDTVLSVWTGDMHPLTEVACNDDDPNSEAVQSWLELEMMAGTTYLIKAGGLNGATGALGLSVNPPAPPPDATPTIYMPVAKNG